MPKYRLTMSKDGQRPFELEVKAENALHLTMAAGARLGAFFVDFAESDAAKSEIVIQYERLEDS